MPSAWHALSLFIFLQHFHINIENKLRCHGPRVFPDCPFLCPSLGYSIYRLLFLFSFWNPPRGRHSILFPVAFPIPALTWQMMVLPKALVKTMNRLISTFSLLMLSILIFISNFFSLKTKSSSSWTTKWKGAEGTSSTCSCWSPCKFGAQRGRRGRSARGRGPGLREPLVALSFAGDHPGGSWVLKQLRFGRKKPHIPLWSGYFSDSDGMS